MYNTIERLYSKTKNKSIVANAVKKGWITKDQFKEITGVDYKA